MTSSTTGTGTARTAGKGGTRAKKNVTKDASSWKLEKMTVTELYAAEKISSLMCSMYDNALREYNGMINTRKDEYTKLNEFNRIHEAVIRMIEKRLMECVQ